MSCYLVFVVLMPKEMCTHSNICHTNLEDSQSVCLRSVGLERCGSYATPICQIEGAMGKWRIWYPFQLCLLLCLINSLLFCYSLLSLRVSLRIHVLDMKNASSLPFHAAHLWKQSSQKCTKQACGKHHAGKIAKRREVEADVCWWFWFYRQLTGGTGRNRQWSFKRCKQGKSLAYLFVNGQRINPLQGHIIWCIICK